MKKLLVLLYIAIICTCIKAREKVEIVETPTYDVNVQSVDYADSVHAEVQQISKVEYAKYVNAIVESINAADTAKVIQTITDTIDSIGYADGIAVIIRSIDRLNNVDQIIFIINAISRIDMAKASSAQKISIMEVALSKVTNDIKWYEYSGLGDGGTGLWAVIARAKYMADRGEDVTELYNIFIEMLRQDLTTNR